jgi:hypothetical protein
MKTIADVEPYPSCINLLLEPDQAITRKIRLDNLGFVPLDFDASVDAIWITNVDPISGTVSPRSTRFIDLFVDADGLAPDIYQTEVSIITNDPNTPEILIPVYLEVVENVAGQSIHIPAGWSYMSSYIEPVDPTLEVVFEEEIACNTLYFMLDGEGIFWPVQGVNTIDDFDPYFGYKVKMNVDDQAVIFGEPVQDKTIQLIEGPNIVSMLSECNIPSSEIFDQIDGQFKYAFDLQDQTVYWPEGGIFSLETLRPGRGYLISMNEEASVTYPECDTKSSWEINETATNQTEFYSVTKTTSHHIISIFADVLDGFEENDLIAAFNSNDRCVGYAEITDRDQNLSLVLFGDDQFTDEVDGLTEGEYINLRLVDRETGLETYLDYEFDHLLPDHLPVFTPGGLSRIVKFYNITSNGPERTTSSTTDVTIFPNPAQTSFTLMFSVKPTDGYLLEIYNMDGRLMMKKLVEEKQSTIRIADLPRGVYVVNVIINGQVINKRIVKQ